jgi:hypothetical protein
MATVEGCVGCGGRDSNGPITAKCYRRLQEFGVTPMGERTARCWFPTDTIPVREEWSVALSHTRCMAESNSK